MHVGRCKAVCHMLGGMPHLHYVRPTAQPICTKAGERRCARGHKSVLQRQTEQHNTTASAAGYAPAPTGSQAKTPPKAWSRAPGLSALSSSALTSGSPSQSMDGQLDDTSMLPNRVCNTGAALQGQRPTGDTLWVTRTPQQNACCTCPLLTRPPHRWQVLLGGRQQEAEVAAVAEHHIRQQLVQLTVPRVPLLPHPRLVPVVSSSSSSTHNTSCHRQHTHNPTPALLDV